MSMIEIEKADAVSVYIYSKGEKKKDHLHNRSMMYIRKLSKELSVDKVVVSTSLIENCKLKLDWVRSEFEHSSYVTKYMSRDALRLFESFAYCNNGLIKYFGEVPKTIYITW